MFVSLLLNCINSSKVYCKFNYLIVLVEFIKVLIVAKCIVNFLGSGTTLKVAKVLIVAKCIVNPKAPADFEICANVLIVAKCIVNWF